MPASDPPPQARRSSTPLRPLLVSALLLLSALSASAHQEFPIQARLEFTDTAYDLVFAFDVPSLMLGRTPDHADPAQAARDLLALSPEDRVRLALQARRFFFLNLKLTLDGARAEPEILLPTFNPGPLGQLGDPAADTFVRFHGPLPPGTQTLTVTPGRALGFMNLEVVYPGGAPPRFEILAAGRTSPALPVAVSAPVPELRPRGRVVGEYLALGLRGVLPLGLDHALFVAALVLLSPGWVAVLGPFLAFALGLSLALGLSTLGYVQVPAAVVEPLIALSIAGVALENLFTNRLHVWRPVLVFAFGLFHGLGLAAELDAGLPVRQAALALFAFNLGAASALFALLLLVWAALGRFAARPWYASRLTRPLSLLVGLLGLFWALERLVRAL